MAQRDVILRWIEQIAKVVNRLLLGPGPGDLDLAAGHVQDAIAQHLGSLAPLLPQLDIHSGAELLHDPEWVFGYAQLLSLLGAVQFARGEPQAISTHDRALAFALEALLRAPNAPDSWHQWVAEAQAWRQGRVASLPDSAS